MKYTIDAQGKKVGRIATEAAVLLMGKNTAEFVRNDTPNVEVEIVNAGKAEITLKRKETELKGRWSEYPSGLKIDTVAHVIEKKGNSELFRRAVSGMLPRNKLRKVMMKNLTITE